LIDKVEKYLTSAFKKSGDLIYLLGWPANHLGGSEYLALIHKKTAGTPPPVHLEQEKKLMTPWLF